ncbi:outer membrane protein [Mesorhizobium dulcispinae]|uniref:outer membrane protein n=1 Tax=Mesorhizobium dulcispinae TaxID=3072316 RepID=UPI002A240752|nr:outer membrane protein [Mesorhizobium sp. VK23D]MDX8521154.1 porin family protein [Mesorhizobium sp. VK23D]
MRAVIFAMVVSATVSPVLAADLEQPIPAELPYSWTGFYAGVNAGAAFDMSKFDNTADPNRFLQPVPNMNFSGTGFLGGVHVGYNYQMGNYVVGVEGSADLGTLDDKAKTPVAPLGSGFIELKQKWLASIAGRIGYAYDRFLVYGTGGVAFTSYGVNTDDSFFIGHFTHSYNDNTRVGWTIGAGVEYAIDPKWTIGVDYKYYDFGSKNYASNFAPAAGPGFDFFKVKERESVVTARLSYRF